MSLAVNLKHNLFRCHLDTLYNTVNDDDDDDNDDYNEVGNQKNNTMRISHLHWPAIFQDFRCALPPPTCCWLFNGHTPYYHNVHVWLFKGQTEENALQIHRNRFKHFHIKLHNCYNVDHDINSQFKDKFLLSGFTKLTNWYIQMNAIICIIIITCIYCVLFYCSRDTRMNDETEH